jgi:tetratricopeptide (TPR) repeat protein
VAPNNPEVSCGLCDKIDILILLLLHFFKVLLNLARLLFTLQYLDDSLFLARRSLELQAPDRNAWAQHFALGEILKAYGHHNEALLHFKVFEFIR